MQTETTKGKGGTQYLPYVFTEPGVAMLGILNSDKAIRMNIEIMCAFVAVRQALFIESDMREQIK